MLKFKSFLKEEKATALAHIPGFDVKNPEHQHMANLLGNIPKNERPQHLRHPNQIKNMNDLHDLVYPQLEKHRQSEENKRQDQSAFADGDAELIHHDPSTGVKIYKVHTEAGSCAAAGADGIDDAQWCTAIRGNGNAFDHYHRSDSDHSYVMHFPQEKDKNLRKVGIYGMQKWQPHSEGVGGNFQKKDNTTVDDHEWDHLVKKYKLNSIKDLHGIRGIGLSYPSNPLNVLKEPDKDKRNYLISTHPNLTSDHIHKLLSHPDNSVRQAALLHKNVNEKNIHKALSDKDVNVRDAALRCENVTPKNLDKALGDRSRYVRKKAAVHPNADSFNLDKALENHQHWEVKCAALRNQNITPDHITTALNDRNKNVRKEAIENGGGAVNETHINKALGDTNKWVRRAAIHSGNVTEGNITNALKNDDVDVRICAASHPNITPDHNYRFK